MDKNKIEIKDLYLIFGSERNKAFKMLKKGKTLHLGSNVTFVCTKKICYYIAKFQNNRKKCTKNREKKVCKINEKSKIT